ncbi:MAG: CCA tRNA nucleotidyltransferase [Patescibacteria group bacterium]
MKKPSTQKKKNTSPKNNQQFDFVSALFKTFPRAECYLVGGAVRDMLLSRPTKDYDFVVRNVPITTLQKFLKQYGTVRLVGKKFGVLKFKDYDIALPRTEHSIANTGHYRDFKIKTDHRLPIEDDLSRRDFTVNALAIDLKTNAVIDPFGGIGDIKKKIIRTVGKPNDRFREDYSRMLRAVRFSCQLGFRIEDDTLSAIKKNIKHLNDEIAPDQRLTKKIDRNTMRVVPYEVIASEMVKTFSAHPVCALDLYDDYGIFKLFIPDLLAMKACPQEKRWHSEGDVWTHTRRALRSLSSTSFAKEFGGTNTSALLALAVLFHDIGKPPTLQTPEHDGIDRIRTNGHDRVGAEMVRRIGERLRLSTAPDFDGDIDDLAWLVRFHLLILTTTVDKLRSRTIEKYFYDNPRRGQLLLRLVFCDSSASIQGNGMPGLQAFRAFKKRLVEFEEQHHLTVRKRALPPPLLNGDDIMHLCKIKPGPRVGELREALREEQLSGRIKTKHAARAWLLSSPDL